MPLQNTIKIQKNNVFTQNGTCFIPLTDQSTFVGLFQRLANKTEDSTKFWASIGRQDNGPIVGEWTGSIVCSKEGNNSFTTRGLQIQQEAEDLRSLFPDMNPPDLSTVYEKFISLDNVSFGTDPAARNLRLTINVSPGQQAVAFLQFADKGDNQSQTGVFSYILPQNFQEKEKVNKLTYYFTVPSQDITGQSRFIVKIMTFKSQPITKMSLAESGSLLRTLDNPYCINVYDRKTNTFIRLDDNGIKTQVDPAKKTLLMIHGTFASVVKSYGDLLDNGWLASVYDKGKYQQIIGFDHYTVVESPQQNSDMLFKMLTPVGTFTQTVDVITSSRGGLVGKSVINNKTQKVFTVERAAPVACANGVQWMTTGESIGKIIGVFRQATANPAGKLLLALAQLSVNNFLNQPGLEIMNKASKNLAALLKDTPANEKMRYYPVCGDYQINGSHPLQWKIFDLLVTAIIKDKNHDWVVETDYQVIMPDANYAYSAQGKDKTFYRSQPIDTTHTRYFFSPMTTTAKQRIYNYLHDPGSVQ